MANENERIRNETERSRKNLELETAECRDKELTRLAEAEARVAELEAKNRVSRLIRLNRYYYIIYNIIIYNYII